MKAVALSILLVALLSSAAFAGDAEKVTEDFLLHSYAGAVLVESKKSFDVMPLQMKFRRDHTVVVTYQDESRTETQGWRLDEKKNEIEFIKRNGDTAAIVSKISIVGTSLRGVYAPGNAASVPKKAKVSIHLGRIGGKKRKAPKKGELMEIR